MIRSLYISASGMLAEQTRNDITANNLANANTSGFKKELALFSAAPSRPIHHEDQNPLSYPFIGPLGTGAYLTGTLTDQSRGSLKPTGNLLDLAVNGDGYFVVQTAQGERYTRNGSFTLNDEGFLVNAEGNPVLGQNGLIQLLPDSPVRIDAQGGVFQNDQMVDMLRVAAIPVAFLQPEGNSLFRVTDPAAVQPDAVSQIQQGYLETSNVNVVQEMVNLIAITRAYEANQKVIQAADSTLASVNEVGRVR